MGSLFKIILGIGAGVAVYSVAKKKKPEAKKYLFIGDSLTAFNKSYVDQIASGTAVFDYKKIAKIGEKTNWMLQKLAEELATGTKYQVITIWGGVNDIYATKKIDQAKINLQKMYDMALATGAQVVALTIIPTKTYKISTSQTVDLTNKLNEWIKSNRSINSLVDVNAIVSDGKNGTKANFLQSDTLHLTEAGQTAVMNEYRNKVNV